MANIRGSDGTDNRLDGDTLEQGKSKTGKVYSPVTGNDFVFFVRRTVVSFKISNRKGPDSCCLGLVVGTQPLFNNHSGFVQKRLVN